VAGGRWFTVPELTADGPVVTYARHCLQQADRASWAAALDAIILAGAAHMTPFTDPARLGMLLTRSAGS
jgi:hypothetical protein